jgi:hypothetical protein
MLLERDIYISSNAMEIVFRLGGDVIWGDMRIGDAAKVAYLIAWTINPAFMSINVLVQSVRYFSMPFEALTESEN